MNTTTLIPVISGAINGETVQLVDARLLHQYLEVRRDFSNWIKGRIDEYGFAKDEDFLVLDSPNSANQKSHGGDRRSKDYLLTLDMAKELAMVERTPRGRQVRRYFIECEQQLRQMKQKTLSMTRPSASIRLTRAERQAINRQAWAEVTKDAQAAFNAKREALIRQMEQRSDCALTDKGDVI
ncbi:antA/AntB antirepressor family protein [Nitrosomonas communis]|uniref:Phage anti-repressor protein n=1 Tax=Nitrosomonas communis TaxID=44574 RepID=A0A1I4LP39_9PROT|nr:antA/AntB antirepressor family protein [Nitrosomonas communis]SFL92671.1 Phage anti-repressor protein [Nitrosomonas communis]